MRIGIIGAGNIGGTLAKQYRATGHTVKIANSRGPETLREFASELGASAVTAREAAQGVDVVIVTIPEKNVPKLPKDLFAGVPADVVVVDTGNYYPGMRDMPIAEIDAGMPESQWVAEHLGRPVVKAYNNIRAYSLAMLGRPKGDPKRIALPVAGDDRRAKDIVLGLIEEAGFDGVDAGTISESWRFQPGTPAYGTDYGAKELRQALAAADRAAAPRLREQGIQKLSQAGGNISQEELTELIRSIYDFRPEIS